MSNIRKTSSFYAASSASNRKMAGYPQRRESRFCIIESLGMQSNSFIKHGPALRTSMPQSKLTKITASVTLEIGQLERLNEAAQRAGTSRSTIVRDAIERELKRYETSTSAEPKHAGRSDATLS